MKRTIVTKFMLFIFAFAIAACSTGTPAVAVKESHEVKESPVINESPSTTSTAIPFPEMAGLDQLNSYTLSLRVSFKGIQDGQALDTTDIYTRMFSLDSSTQFTTIQTTDEDGKSTSYIRGWVGDVLYMRGGFDEPCTARIVSSADRQSFNPAVLIQEFAQGKEIGLETVNGVSTHHYAMNTVQGAKTQMSGEVWIAEPAKYIVRYSMSLKGGEEYFGKGITGEKTISFEVSDAGANKPVSLPAGCPPPLTDIPAMPDAEDVTRSLSQLSYITAASINDTVAFYKEQMKALGWNLELSSIPSDLTQPSTGIGFLPDLSKLTQVPGGLDLKTYLPTANQAKGAPVSQDSWLIFIQAQEQESAYLLLQPEGAKLRVQIQIQQG